MEYVGEIRFSNYILGVYGDLDQPYFLATDVARLIDYSLSNTSHMLEQIDSDEKVLAVLPNDISRTTTTRIAGNPNKWFLTELGLYEVLSQSRKPLAKRWRRIVYLELIKMRKDRQRDIEQQFAFWDRNNDIFLDEETGLAVVAIELQGTDLGGEEWITQ